MRAAVYRASCRDPYRNLAVEECLLQLAQDRCILYLWQNENTVVIGKNQNPWQECRLGLLEQEGGKLARRLSGGGAVYHDGGNLNFTFLMPREIYDVPRQLGVIREAVGSFGLEVVASGRNDLLVGGGKFSGNAFYKTATSAYHHGTLLVAADMEKLGRYLSPSKVKLQSKGVDSVRSRVVNLSDLCGGITVATLARALEAAFAREYGGQVDCLTEADLDAGKIAALQERNGSWDWKFGRKMPFDGEVEGRFAWGCVQLQLQIQQGSIQAAKVYTDAMDWELAPNLEGALTGCALKTGQIQMRLQETCPHIAADIIAMLQEAEML